MTYKEIISNIWNDEFKNEMKVITTNGFVKNNGECVMGRGVALQAKRKFRSSSFHSLPFIIGKKIKENGNHCYLIKEYNLITFPTKHNWWETSDIELIRSSMLELIMICKLNNIKRIIMTKPGCGNGKLNWIDVKRKINDLLEITVIEFIIVDMRD